MRSHTVKSGDTLGAISITYLGTFAGWGRIVDANPQLAGRKKASDGSPLIFPGDVLIIPATQAAPPVAKASTPKAVLDDGAEQDFSLMLNGTLFTGFTAFKLVINDDAPDAFSFSAPFDPEQDIFKKSFKPLSYMDCTVYYNKKIVFAGKLRTPDSKVTADSRIVDLQGSATCGILQDCTIPDTKFPPAYAGMGLSDIASDAAAPFGISVVMDGDAGAAFDEVAYDVGEKVWAFLAKLAKQRGLVLTNDDAGALRFWNAPAGASVATFREDDIRFIDCVPKWDDSNFYSHITGYAKVNEDKDVELEKYTFENPYLTNAGVLRPFAYTVDDTEGADLEKAVTAKAAAMLCTCVSYELTVTGATDKDGNLFGKGCCVTVCSPTAYIFSDTKLQVKAIEISRDDTNGTMTKLSLVLPGLRNNEIPAKWPWEE